jgi:DNA-binding CsgD family transcriptional regulator
MRANQIMGWSADATANSMDAAVEGAWPGGDAMAPARPTLTRREVEVLRLLARGRSYGAIATQLGMSVHTVASHVRKLYLKLDVHTAAAAVMRAVELRLLGRA